MKVEYSYYKSAPCMVVKGTDFLNAMKDKKELHLLEIAVESFCSWGGSPIHFDDEVNSAIAGWLSKSGTVFYVVVEIWLGHRCTDSWCEVYVQNGAETVEVVISDDYGRNYMLNREGKRHA